MYGTCITCEYLDVTCRLSYQQLLLRIITSSSTTTTIITMFDYCYSEVLSADAFAAFEEAGLEDEEAQGEQLLISICDSYRV